MSLRRTIKLSIYYIYRRLLLLTRNSRYSSCIMITLVIYLIIFIFIQQKAMLPSLKSIADYQNPQQQPTIMKEHNEKHQNDITIKQSLSLSMNKNASYVFSFSSSDKKKD